MSQPRKVYKHSCRIKWMTKIRTIDPYPMDICVTFCPSWRINTKDRGMLTKSRKFPSIRLWQWIMIETQAQRFRARRRPGLKCCCHSSRIRVIPPIMEESSATTCCTVRLLCISASTCHIVLRYALGRGPTSCP